MPGINAVIVNVPALRDDPASARLVAAITGRPWRISSAFVVAMRGMSLAGVDQAFKMAEGRRSNEIVLSFCERALSFHGSDCAFAGSSFFVKTVVTDLRDPFFDPRTVPVGWP